MYITQEGRFLLGRVVYAEVSDLDVQTQEILSEKIDPLAYRMFSNGKWIFRHSPILERRAYTEARKSTAQTRQQKLFFVFGRIQSNFFNRKLSGRRRVEKASLPCETIFGAKIMTLKFFLTRGPLALGNSICDKPIWMSLGYASWGMDKI